jgi:hypothetical protein
MTKRKFLFPKGSLIVTIHQERQHKSKFVLLQANILIEGSDRFVSSCLFFHGVSEVMDTGKPVYVYLENC